MRGMEDLTEKIWLIKILTGILLSVISFFDIRERRIPDRLTALLFGLGCVQFYVLWADVPPDGSHVRFFLHYFFAAFLVSGLLAALTFLAPGSFGGGDIKLMAAAGWMLGVRAVMQSFAAAVWMCGAYILVQMARGKLSRKSELPFGPFLCAGILLFLLRG